MSKEDRPNDQEIEDSQLTRKLAISLDKLQTNEESVMKGIEDLADRLKKSNHELKNYLEIQTEASRLYIQLVTRNSDLIHQDDLKRIKEHVKKVEDRISVQLGLQNAFLELAGGYKEYHKTLKDYSKAMANLNKAQKAWHDSSAELAKAQSSQAVSGGKLDKIEKSIGKNKREVIKMYDDRHHRENFVDTAMKRVNQVWLKLKDSIKNVAW